MDSAQEKEFIERAKEGDQEAFEWLVEAYKNLVRDRIYAFLPDHHKMHTDEVHQDTFVKAYNALPDFEIRHPGDFANWLTKIAKNTCLDLLRRKRMPTVEFDENIDSIWERGLGTLLEDQDVGPLHERVGSALAKLDYDCRILLLASLAYGVPPVEIARFARHTLEPEGKNVTMAARVREWFQELIGPLEKQSTDRRNYCFAKLKKNCQKSSSPISKHGLKRESRGGTTKPNSQ